MVACFWLMPFFLDNLAGGLARSFAAPLLALFWLGWQARRPWVMGAALLLQALFIPYIFLVAALAALLAWLLARLGRDSPPPFPAQAAHFCLLGLGAVLVVAMNLQFSADGYGPLVSAAEMVNHPEFYAHGRYQILPEPSLCGNSSAPGNSSPRFGNGARWPAAWSVWDCWCWWRPGSGAWTGLPGGNGSNPPGTWDWPPWSSISWPGSSC